MWDGIESTAAGARFAATVGSVAPSPQAYVHNAEHNPTAATTRMRYRFNVSSSRYDRKTGERTPGGRSGAPMITDLPI